MPFVLFRTSIASYRAEATFFKTLAKSVALNGIAPHAFWVHVDDRLGDGPSFHHDPRPSNGSPFTVDAEVFTAAGVNGGREQQGGRRVEGGAKKEKEEEEEVLVTSLRESCFMMITGGWW